MMVGCINATLLHTQYSERKLGISCPCSYRNSVVDLNTGHEKKKNVCSAQQKTGYKAGVAVHPLIQG